MHGDKHTKTGLVLGILFFGSLWGLSEAVLGDWLYANHFAHSSVYLTAIALVILAAAKVISPSAWTGTIIGLVAILFKTANVPVFVCHFWGIALLGASFDVAYALAPRFAAGKYRLPFIAITAVYLSHVVFALSITYIFRYHYWTEVGFPKVIDYIFVSGSMSAIIGLTSVPAGNYLAGLSQGMKMPALHPRLAASMVLLATVCIWIIPQAL